MNRRQRRKHRVGEFQELGFEVGFSTPATWAEAEQTALWDGLIAQVESHGLELGGSSGNDWLLFITGAEGHASVTPEQRQALIEWLASQAGVTDLEAGPLEDAWVD